MPDTPISSRLCGEPVCHFGVSALAGKVRGGLAKVAGMVRLGAGVDEHRGQIAAVGGGGGKQWSEAADLDGIGVGAMSQEQPHRFRVAAQGQSGMKRLGALRIFGDRGYLGSVLQKHIDRLRRAEGGGEMQGRPPISRRSVDRTRIGGEDVFQPEQVSHGGGFKDVEQEAVGGHLGQEKIAHHGLAGIDGPQQGGDSLVVARLDQGGIGFDGGGDLRCGAGLDQFEEILAHGRGLGLRLRPYGLVVGVGTRQGWRLGFTESGVGAVFLICGPGPLGVDAELNKQVEQNGNGPASLEGGCKGGLANGGDGILIETEADGAANGDLHGLAIGSDDYVIQRDSGHVLMKLVTPPSATARKRDC